MIKVEATVDYPDLTPSEKARLCEIIRRNIQPALFSAACSMQLDPKTVDDWHGSSFLLSQKLEVTSSVKVIK